MFKYFKYFNCLNILNILISQPPSPGPPECGAYCLTLRLAPRFSFELSCG